MTRTEAADMVRNRWQFLGIGTPEEFPRVFSSDVENMMASTGNILDAQPTYHTSRGGNSNGLHVAQGSAPESDQHSAISELDEEQKRNGCVAQMDMPRNDAVTADESSASAAIQISEVADQGRGIAPLTESITVGIGGEATAIASPLYLLASEIVDIVEFSAQYRAEEEAAAEEGALIEASGYNDPATDRSFA